MGALKARLCGPPWKVFPLPAPIGLAADITVLKKNVIVRPITGRMTL